MDNDALQLWVGVKQACCGSIRLNFACLGCSISLKVSTLLSSSGVLGRVKFVVSFEHLRLSSNLRRHRVHIVTAAYRPNGYLGDKPAFDGHKDVA